MSLRLDNTRSIRAPRGRKLSAKCWLTEAPLRMMMNNLDAESPRTRTSLWSMAASAAPRATGSATTHPRSAYARSRTTRPCWSNRASRSAFSARTPTRRAC